MTTNRHNRPATTEAMITPATGILRRKIPLTFGSFLPSKFQSIEEESEIETAGIDPAQNPHARGGKEQVKKEIHEPRRLQFSEIGTDKQPRSERMTDQTERDEGLKNNRASQMGKPLTCVPPSMRDGKVVVKIVEDDIKAQQEKWNSALIGYVLGDTPYVRSMDNYVNTQTIPLWVKFPGLPVGYWSSEALGKLASGIGKPLYTDKTTADMERISYARVLIEVDVAQPLPECIEIDMPFGTFQQQVTYDWRPKFCVDCIKFGHDAENCRRIELGAKENTYQEKGQQNEQEISTQAKGKNKAIPEPMQNDPMMIMGANRFAVLRIEEPKTAGEELVGQYGHIEADFLNPGVSDHFPVILRCGEKKRMYPKPFKFFTNVMEHPEFHARLKRVWEQEKNMNAMLKVSRKLPELKHELKDLNQYMASYQQRLNQARQQLEVIQANMHVQPFCQSLFDQEKEILADLDKWSNIEEQVLRQKSRANWILCGDSNSKYIHAQWKIRQSKNTISSIYTETGIKLTDPVQVESEFIVVFKGLMGSCSGEIRCPNSEIIKKGPVLTREQQVEMIR
ncbi:hypothetical protein A4A49_36675 [Nicotiana attenuata]|uniref:Uncharacterized protein n=1 Tax=Nicotiana attenuata TaxID=49451 RepID=A0A1J6K3T9_NICAT|nr:hypothetical protein A4A49_36675 [Nicotiana attenuata]